MTSQCRVCWHLRVILILFTQNLFHGCHYTSAGSVPDDDNMFDTERLHSESQCTHCTVIVQVKLVGHIAQYKQLTRASVAHDTLWDTGVTAADPQHLRVLALAQRLRNVWLL